MNRTQYNFIDLEVAQCLERLANNDKQHLGLLSGFTQIDNVIGGFHGGDIITIAGRPGMGKTAFAMSLASNIAMNPKTPVMYFSLRLSKEILVLRFLSSFSEIPLQYLIDCTLPLNKWEELEKAEKNISKMSLVINETPIEDFNSIRMAARLAARESGVKAIFIDALHYIPIKYRKNRSQNDEIAEMMYMIKALAIELDIPIFITSLLSRGDRNEWETYKQPELHELRDSGVIEDVSDTVMFIHRPECYHVFQDEHGNDLRGLAEIHISKSPMGFDSKVNMEYKVEYAKFIPRKIPFIPYPKESLKPPFETFV